MKKPLILGLTTMVTLGSLVGSLVPAAHANVNENYAIEGKESILSSLTKDSSNSILEVTPITEEKDIYSKKIKTEAGLEISFGKPTISTSNSTSKSRSFSLLNNDETLRAETEKVDNSLVQKITIDPEKVNSTITIPLELNDDFYLELGKDEYGNTDGAALIYNAEGNSVAIINSPVSDNPNLKIVNAEIVDEHNIQLNLESKQEINQNTNLMVTATATVYKDYFWPVGQWVTRSNGLIALRLYPTSFLISGTTNDQLIKAADSWNKVKVVHSGNSNWYNQSSIEDQYFCHYGYAKTESDWNLEPARPDVGITKTIFHRCNAPT